MGGGIFFLSTLSMLSMFVHPIPRLSRNKRFSMESTESIYSSPPDNTSSCLRQYIVSPQTIYCTLTFGLGGDFRSLIRNYDLPV